MSNKCLEANYELTKGTCDGSFEWLVVCNHPSDKYDGRFMSLPGVKMPNDTGCNVNKHSHHHALALNSAIPHLTSRFILFLDPDFYVVPSHSTVLKHMVDNDIGVFGAPYMLDRKWRPYQDIPVAFCMYVDRTKVDISKWDFLPVPQPDPNKWYDTGHKVYEECKRNHKYDIALPHCPRRYIRATGHKYTGNTIQSLYNIIAPTGDQYFWHDKLFGFHIHMKLHLTENNPGKIHQKLSTIDQISNMITRIREHDSII